MTLTTHVNGTSGLLVNGLKTVNGIGGGGQLSAHPTATTALDDDLPVYESDWNPDYLEGYTLEDVARARPLSNPYAHSQLPPYAKLRHIDISSFRSGHRPTPEDLHREIRMTYEGQLPLTQILDAIVQDSYAHLTELAEVMPSFNDRERKMRLIQYAVNTRKQIIKVYAISKWARVADDVQKALDTMTFLIRTEWKIKGASQVFAATFATIHSSRRRNADLMTAVDVLSTGTYQRLPTIIKDVFQDYKPITDDEVVSTLTTLNDAILFRLKFCDIIPVPMSDYQVEDGRVWFTVPGLFEVALTLTGPEETDYWYALDVRFLVAPKGEDAELLQDFPSSPHPWLKTQIINSLNYQLVMNSDGQLDVGNGQAHPRPRRDPSKMDAPLVRMHNALQMLSLSYQLEILYQQAARMMKLDWQDMLAASMDTSRKSFAVSYWKRPTQNNTNQGQVGAVGRQDPIPPTGGTVIFSIATDPQPVGPSSATQPHVTNVLTILESKTKIREPRGSAKEPSDTTELATIRVEWKPELNALAIPVPASELRLDLAIDSTQLDLEGIVKRITRLHARTILRAVSMQLLPNAPKSLFSDPSQVKLEGDVSSGSSLRICLCGSQEVLLSVDDRSGRLVLKDVGVLAAFNRSGRFLAYSVWLNRRPNFLPLAIRSLKTEIIIAEIEHQARYLGLQATRSVAVPPMEVREKFGNVKMALYIRLKPFPNFYLAMIATDEETKWALVNLMDVPVDNYHMRSIRDFGWLDAERIGGADDRERAWAEVAAKSFNNVLKQTGGGDASMGVKTEVLRELYAFCCARVSHTIVEQQLKTRGIQWTSVFSPKERGKDGQSGEGTSPESRLLSPFSSTARSVPIICIRISDTVRSERAANVAYENVKIKVVDWWSERPCRVVTSVRLREVQLVAQDPSEIAKEQPFDPARNITYNPTTSIVSFTSYDINTCVDEFLQEWARVERVAGIAREVDQARARRQWPDIRILRFNLQSVEFVYHSTYTLSIQWIPPSESGDQNEGIYAMDFDTLQQDGSRHQPNPHQDVAISLSRRLHSDASKSMTFAVERLIMILRDSLPVLLALQTVKQESGGKISMFTKSAAWYRLLFGQRHILDFRLLPNQQIAVADAALSPFSRVRAGDDGNVDSVLAPLAGFQEVAHALAKEVQATPAQRNSSRPTIPPIVVVDGGVLCNGPSAPSILQSLCAELSKRLWPPS